MGALSVLALAVATTVCTSHELSAHRLTLVQRETNELSLSVQLDYPRVLHRALEPARLAMALQRVQIAFEGGAWLLPDGSALPLQRCRWPDAPRVQAHSKQQVIRWIAGPGDKDHAP
jgi:hypothetical protein